MVFPGQYLERPALVAAGGVVLEGLYHRGERAPALLLCPPPGAGGGMDAPALAEMAWACARSGHASLRFQHQGVGGSQGTPDPARAIDDAEAALRHLAETAGARVAVAGFRAGCETALALLRAHPEIARGVLVAPERLPPGAPRAAVLALLPETGAALRGADLESLLSPAGGRVEVVPGADPLFHAGLPLVGRRAVEWVEAGAPR